MLTKKPNRRTKRKQGEEFRHLRNPASRTALGKLRQARRCEQLAFRIQMLKDEGKGEKKTQTYYQLNVDAIRIIRKRQGAYLREHEGIVKLKQTNQVAESIALIPSIKRLAEKYHEEVHKQKELAERESERCKKKRYEPKGEGQWVICKDMGSVNANPH